MTRPLDAIAVDRRIDHALPRYLAALSSGNRRAATGQALSVLAAGAGLEDVVLRLVLPAQVEVGRRWQHAEWTVAQEHRATALSEAAMAAVAHAVDEDRRGPQDDASGVRLVVACAEGDWHGICAVAVGHVLAARGWDVEVLAPSVPADDLQAHLAATQPLAVALTCTVAEQLLGAARSVAAARDAKVPVLVGGRAFGVGPVRAARIGATGWAPDPVQADALLRGWAHNGAPATPEPDLDRSALGVLAAEADVVEEAVAAIRRRGPAVVRGDVRYADHTRRDLASLVRCLAVALVIDDAAVLSDLVRWLAVVLAVRGVPAPALVGGLVALRDAVAPLHARAVEVLDVALGVVVAQPPDLRTP